MDDILAAFAGHAALIADNRRKAEEARRQAALEQARRERLKAFNDREERRSKFVDAVAENLAQRARLQAVLAHLEATASDTDPGPGGMGEWLKRRLAELDALLSPQFLELSARSAKIGFDEARDAAKPAEPSWYYPRAIELRLWSVDEAQDQASSQSSFEWARAAGLVPNVEAEPTSGEESSTP